MYAVCRHGKSNKFMLPKGTSKNGKMCCFANRHTYQQPTKLHCQTDLSLSKELLVETLAMLYVTITKTDSCTASGRKITSKGLLSPRCEYHDIKSK